jgi:hypothetical protein
MFLRLWNKARSYRGIAPSDVNTDALISPAIG